jgi:hypothetical protein
MVRVAETYVELIRPPEPPRRSAKIGDPDGEEIAAAWQERHAYASRERTLRRLRKRAHLASHERLLEAIRRLNSMTFNHEDGVMDGHVRADPSDIARLARAVVREADRMKHERRLRVAEETWVREGVARWCREGDVPT